MDDDTDSSASFNSGDWYMDDVSDDFEEKAKTVKVKVHVNPKFLDSDAKEQSSRSKDRSQEVREPHSRSKDRGQGHYGGRRCSMQRAFEGQVLE